MTQDKKHMGVIFNESTRRTYASSALAFRQHADYGNAITGPHRAPWERYADPALAIVIGLALAVGAYFYFI